MILSGVVAASLAGVLMYNEHAFGSVRGPYWEGSMLWTVSHVVPVGLGLHWDQAHGLFLQQPLLLVGLFGLLPMAWFRPRPAGFLALVYLSIIVPNAMHVTLYGGYSFVGRMMWSAFPLWIYPFCHGFGLVRSSRWRGGLLLAALLWQLTLAPLWLRGGALLNTLSADNSLYPWARTFLPAYHDPAAAWTHGPNYVFLLAGLLLAVSGSWKVRRLSHYTVGS